MASAVHLAFHEFEFWDLAFCLTVRPRQCDRRTNGRLILGDAIGERCQSARRKGGMRKAVGLQDRWRSLVTLGTILAVANAVDDGLRLRSPRRSMLLGYTHGPSQ
jgi:hypothetical protein